MDPVPFNALAVQDAPLKDQLIAAIARVVERGWYVLGEELAAFEHAFAPIAGCSEAVGVGNGTDALRLALQAVGVGAGDEVVTVSHTATFTALAISMLGARPVFCDIDPRTFTMDPTGLDAVVNSRTKAIVPVHLYGQAAALDEIVALASLRGVPVVEDCAQAHGALYSGRPVGSFGACAAFSFYPTKNLGALGDGGAVTTSDPDVAARVRRLRNGGQEDRYRHVERGVNSRLDEVQAAALLVKLARLDSATTERRVLAAVYDQSLEGVTLPLEVEGRRHVYHLYVFRHPRRDALAEHLKEQEIGTQVHYPIPVHRQPAYVELGIPDGTLPETERAAAEVLSLPLFPRLTSAQQRRVIEAVNAFTTASDPTTASEPTAASDPA